MEFLSIQQMTAFKELENDWELVYILCSDELDIDVVRNDRDTPIETSLLARRCPHIDEHEARDLVVKGLAYTVILQVPVSSLANDVYASSAGYDYFYAIGPTDEGWSTFREQLKVTTYVGYLDPDSVIVEVLIDRLFHRRGLLKLSKAERQYVEAAYEDIHKGINKKQEEVIRKIAERVCGE
jgi:hypothetical protein